MIFRKKVPAFVIGDARGERFRAREGCEMVWERVLSVCAAF